MAAFELQTSNAERNRSSNCVVDSLPSQFSLLNILNIITTEEIFNIKGYNLFELPLHDYFTFVLLLKL